LQPMREIALQRSLVGDLQKSDPQFRHRPPLGNIAIDITLVSGPSQARAQLRQPPRNQARLYPPVG